eukprot:c17028_g1_i1 orf=1111-1539(-)
MHSLPLHSPTLPSPLSFCHPSICRSRRTVILQSWGSRLSEWQGMNRRAPLDVQARSVCTSSELYHLLKAAKLKCPPCIACRKSHTSSCLQYLPLEILPSRMHVSETVKEASWVSYVRFKSSSSSIQEIAAKKALVGCVFCKD